MKPKRLLPFASVVAATLSCASAELLVYQGFNGYAAGPLPGQTIGGNVQGLNTTATITSAGTGANANVSDATGLSFSNLVVNGGKGIYSDATGRPSYIGFAYTGATVTGNLYSSYLVRIATTQNSNSVVSLRVNATPTSGGAASYFHSYADVVGNTFTASQYDLNNQAVSSGTTLAINTTYVVLGRFTNVGTALSAGSPGLATTYVLTADQFDFFKDGGFTDAELDGASVGSGQNNVTSRISDAPVTTGTFTLTAGNGIQFGPGNAAANQNVSYDELRFGTTFDDVLPLVPVAPPDPVNVAISVSSASAQEPSPGGDAVASFTLTREGDTTNSLRIYLTSGGTATPAIDYPEVPSSVLIPAGSSSLVIPVPAYTDLLDENDETVSLTMTAGDGYNLPVTTSGTVTLSDRPVGARATRARFVQKIAAGMQQKILVYGTSQTANGLWPSRMTALLNATWPGSATLVNRGAGGMASDYGIANLNAQVIAAAPDVVFIEFSINDAVDRFNIPVSQAKANLEAMVTGIQAALPNCEIILQVMNPVIDRPQGHDGWRPHLAYYEQVYRDVAVAHGLMLIDHHAAWQGILDVNEDEFAYYDVVPDGLHPNAAGEEIYLLPVLMEAIGGPRSPLPTVIVDETEAIAVGTWPSSTTSPGAYLAAYLNDQNLDKGTKTVTYQPVVPAAGTYPVYLRWTAHENRATNVPVTIHHSGGTTQVVVSQTTRGGIWNKLGDFPLTGTETDKVVIETTGTNGFVIADAVAVELPAISVRVTNGRPIEPGGSGQATQSTLIVSRTGSLDAALEVSLTLGGSAVNGTDYDTLPASITVPAGKTSVEVAIVPKADSSTEEPESLTIAPVLPPGYIAGGPPSASLSIVDPNDSPFAVWQRATFSAAELANPAISGPDADPDGDGLSNLLERYTGSAPFTANQGVFMSAPVTLEGVNYLALAYPHAPGTGLGAIPEISSDLQAWQSGNLWLEVTATGDMGALQQVTARSRAAVGSVPREFIRLRVTP